tara:strand:+ start:404 stop:826 length:423 start_codon:yes stop_codon:yes gene_type:complete
MRKDLLFLSLIIVLPGLIIFNYKKQFWDNCGIFIKEQNSIWENEVKPEIDKSINEIFVDRNTVKLDEEFSDKYISLTNNSLKLLLSIDQIKEKGIGMKDPSGMCKSAGNKEYKKWLNYPQEKFTEEIKKRKLYYEFNNSI